MRRANAPLVVPVRDRRQGRRILTLKNLRNAVLVALVIFAAITIAGNFRKPAETESFGRLYGQKVESAAKVSRPQEIVRESPVDDATSADPTLVAAQARSQILTGESDPTAPPAPPPPPAPTTPPPLVGHDASGRLVVVGGPEGVKLVERPAAPPRLGGGFGRQ